MTNRTYAIVAPDEVDWDAFVQAHLHGHMLQSTGWARLKGSVGWDVRRVAVAGPNGLIAGAQVLLRRRMGLSAAYVPRGPLLAGNAEADALLLGALDRIARRVRAVFLRLEPNILEDQGNAGHVHSDLLLAGFDPVEPIQPRSTVHLDLTPAPETLLTAISKGHRADIRRAAREGVAVRVGGGQADLDAFYAIMAETAARAAFAIHSRDYYAAAWEIFGGMREDGDARLLLAEREGNVVAAFLVFAWAGAGLYLYGGSTEEGLKRGANHALQWEAIQWARRRGAALYDFWGIPDLLGQAALTSDEVERQRLEEQATTDPLHGVFRFKKGFGGRVVRYLPAYDRVYLPPLYALWRKRGLGG